MTAKDAHIFFFAHMTTKDNKGWSHDNNKNGHMVKDDHRLKNIHTTTNDSHMTTNDGHMTLTLFVTTDIIVW